MFGNVICISRRRTAEERKLRVPLRYLLAAIVLAYWIKGRKEESVLAAQFGEEFKEHCRHTGFLFPKF
jgi:protein-S-isoprenylcysteine O-methyltransferase Ste14